MGVRFVARLIDSLSSPPRANVTKTWLTGKPEWVEYFGLTISAHHGTTVEPLGLTGFEVAFRNACEAVGWAVDEPGSATRRFVDAIVQVEEATQRKLSLNPDGDLCVARGAPLSAFAADGPTVDCSYHDEPVAAKVSLDRSDAKITIRQINLSVCTLHAEWHMAQP